MIDATEIDRRRLVWLVWAYLALLVGEGALRKWVLPGWSDVLLITRDPVAVAILVLAFRGSGLCVPGGPSRGFALVAGSFVAVALLQLTTGQTLSLPVLLFGLRTYCLHPPLIFVIGRVLTVKDLRRMALATMILMVPIAFLMVQQFRASPTDWINSGAGEGRTQLRSALGHIRPPGPFSFISGPVLFYSFGLACLIGAHFARGRDLLVARSAGWAALIVAGAVSGSRSFIVGLAPVFASAFTAVVMRPAAAGRFLRGAFTAGLIATFIWSSTTVQDGLEVLGARVVEAAGTEDMFARAFGTYTTAAYAWTTAPLLGYGIGLGTNAGNALLGASAFRLGEDEWTRVILEAGPLVGLGYLLWRVWLALWLTRAALRAASRGYVLPLLYVGACVANVVSGNWGQPTSQGFAVWTAGMAVAACRVALAAAVVAPRPAATGVQPIGRPIGAPA